MMRHTPSSQLRQKLLYLAIFVFLTLFLICSNTIYLHSPCSSSGHGGGEYSLSYSSRLSLRHRGNNGPSGSADQAIMDDSISKSYVFPRDQPNLIVKLSADSNTSKTSIDLLLTIRKLTLFAVQQLNKRVGAGNCASGSPGCAKWWTNPLRTMALKIYYVSESQTDYDLTFVAEPNSVAFFVRIRQYNLLKVENKLNPELLIKGKFYRLDKKPVEKANFNSTIGIDAVRIAEDAGDPELITWRRNQSFMVGDYIPDFKARGLYKIYPGQQWPGNNVTVTVTRAPAHQVFCGKALKMVVMVSSAPKHFEHRRTIRESYGSEENLKGKGVKVVFLFGRVTDDKLQGLLEDEARKYDDLIQADFTDSYHNLSLSHLLMYNWVQVTCEEHGLPKYVLKADDDFFLNVDLALRVAEGNQDYPILGTAYCGTKPVRNLAYMTKYYTPKYMYMAELYVGYLSGVAYVLQTHIIPAVLKLSLTTPFIHMDDAYVTGLIARQLNIFPMGSQLFTYGRSEPGACSTRKMANSYALSIEDMKTQWNEFRKPIPSNCSLDYLNDLIRINPFRPQDMVACVLQ